MRTQVTLMVSNYGKLLTKWHVSISKHHVKTHDSCMFGYFFCLQNYNRVCRNLYSLWEFLYPVLHLWHPGSNSKACGCRSLATFSSQTFLRKIFSPHWQRSDCFKSLAVTNNAAGYLAFLRSNMPQIHLLAALAEILQETTVVSREVQTPRKSILQAGTTKQ